MAFTQADLDRIDKAIASGVLTVEVDGRRVTYQKMEDLERARARIEASLTTSANTIRQTFAEYSPE